MKGYRTLGLILVLALVAGGCGSAKMKTTFNKPAEAPAPVVAKTPVNPVDQAIASAKERFFQGEQELNLGHLEKAKQEFDASLDILMSYQASHDQSTQIQAVIDELSEKIFAHEMAALREGDGFTERSLEPAMIDDLKNIDTFPPADAQTKNEVQQELKTVTYDIPVEVNDTVLSFISIFQNSRRKEFVGGLVRSGRYLNLMKQIFQEEGVPQDLVYTALIESSFKSNAYSHARAKGFWQFISGTAKRYDLRMDWWVDERSDFERSTRAAARYLKDLYGMFGDWYLALAGYNTGENNIVYGIRQTGYTNFWDLYNTRYMRQETKNYVPAILAGMIIAKDPQKYGFTEVPDEPLEFDQVNVNYAVDLRLVAECTGSSFEEVKQLNPELNRFTTPPKNNEYILRVPKSTKETFLTEISSVPVDKRITWRKHEVKTGDSLTSIAANYHTSVNSISAVNSFDSGTQLSVGQKLIIPIGRSSEATSSRSSQTITTGSKKYYSVRKGDTLSKIASKYQVSVDQLSAWNGFSNGSLLKPGDSMIVRYVPTKVESVSAPNSSKVATKIVYRVKRGDTLFQIASNYDTDVDSIRKWNNLNSRNIYPGDKLTIYRK